LTPTTPTPEAAAARSFAFAASSRRPVRPRRMFATATAPTTNTAMANTVKRTGWSNMPSCQPNRLGSPTVSVPFAVSSPDIQGLPRATSSRTRLRPMVTTARLAPRQRSAGRPTTTPTAPAASEPSSTAGTNGSPALAERFAAVTAPTPAMVIWASEICPA